MRAPLSALAPYTHLRSFLNDAGRVAAINYEPTDGKLAEFVSHMRC